MEKTSPELQKDSENPKEEPQSQALETPPEKEKRKDCWVEYLTGKKVAAETFIKRTSKDAIRFPLDDEKDRFAAALSKKPDRVVRLYQLVFASAEANDSIQRVVMDLALLGIKRLGVVALSDPSDGLKFRVELNAWLEKIEKKPLKVDQLNILLLALLWGWRCKLVGQDDIYGCLELAVSSPKKKSPVKPQKAESNPAQVEVLFRIGAKRDAIKALLEYHEVSRVEKEKLNRQIQDLLSEKVGLERRCEALQSEISKQREQIEVLQDEKQAALSRIEALEKELVETRDGFQHRLYELRGRIKGVLQGQLTRWLETALDASRDDAPWMPVIQERLEDALKLIKKESEALSNKQH